MQHVRFNTDADKKKNLCIAICDLIIADKKEKVKKKDKKKDKKDKKKKKGEKEEEEEDEEEKDDGETEEGKKSEGEEGKKSEGEEVRLCFSVFEWSASRGTRFIKPTPTCILF